MSTEKYFSTIPDALAGLRLDQALAKMFPDYSRNRLKSWLLEGAVLVDGEVRRPRDKVDGGEDVELTATVDVAVRSKPEPMPLEVVHEDDDHRIRVWDWAAWRALIEASPFRQTAAYDGSTKERAALPVDAGLQGRLLVWHELVRER